MLSTLQQEGVLAPPMPWSAEETFSLAAEGQVNDEKLHQGVTGKKAGLHQGAMACNSTTALGVSWGQSSRTASGATVTYDYDAFGNKINSTGTTPNNYLYRGEQWNTDLGLYYLSARYYNPLTGRFMSRDPKDPELRDANGVPVDPKNLHKYLYANGDPVNGWDPTGRGDDEVDYGFLTWNRAKAVAREFGPFFVNCFKGIIDALGSDLQVVEYRDPLYFQEILERIAARCTQGLFFNPN